MVSMACRNSCAELTALQGAVGMPREFTKLFSRRKTNHRAIMATWNMTRTNVEPPLRDFSPSGYEMALAVYAAYNKWTPQEICDLLVRWRCRHELPIAKLHWKRVLTTMPLGIRGCH